MNLRDIHRMYFIGIGGIGMSALALYFYQKGVKVAGYDRQSSALTKQMEKAGIYITYSDDVAFIPQEYSQPSPNTLIAFTPAIPSAHPLRLYFEDRGFVMMKRAVLLGMITKEGPCIAVGGTHGKTTTTALLTHLLLNAGYPITAFVGGIMENYGTQLINKGKAAFIVEADEYDRSFLWLKPDWACITAMDSDHLDIYGFEESLITSFKEFASAVPSSNRLFRRWDLNLEGYSFGLEGRGDYSIDRIEIINGNYNFRFHYPSGILENLQFSLPGKHNLLNAAAALALAESFGMDMTLAATGLATFQGVQRRFSRYLLEDGRLLIDDYAHHPKEIEAISHAVKDFFPRQRNHLFFQPHLYSRTRDFLADFAESLALFDRVSLLPIYPARELPIDGVSSENLSKAINHPKVDMINKKDLNTAMVQSDAEVLICMGAGDIGEEVQKIKFKIRHES